MFVPFTPNLDWTLAKSPGTLRKNGLAGDTVTPNLTTRNQLRTRACLANGTSTTVITTATTIPLTSLTNDTEETEPSCWIATLASNELTFKREGFYLATFCMTIGYESDTGTSGATMKEAKVNAWIKAGGEVFAASSAWGTLVSKFNYSGLITCDGDIEQSVDIGSATGKTDAFTVQTEVPFTFNSADGYLTDVATTVDLLMPTGLDGDNKMPVTLDSPQSRDITSNLTKVTAYPSQLFGQQTITGTCLIQVVPTAADTYKVRIAGTNYGSTLKIEATATYGGDGTVDPVAVCTSLTVTLLRL